MRDVTPLPPDRRGDRVRARPSLPEHVPPPPPPPIHERDEDVESDDRAYAADGVDRRELRKLKRGEYEPGDSLDLHGLTAAAASTRVTSFLERSRGRHRCVAIIHGRGLRSSGNVAVLKTRVRTLLRQHRAVLAYANAPANAGGPGAVYVLLRR